MNKIINWKQQVGIIAVALGTSIYNMAPAAATETTAHSIQDEGHCVTGKTRSNNARRSCYIKLDIQAPSGYAFDPSSIELVQIANGGTGFGCGYLTMHRRKAGRVHEVVYRVTAQVNARSPKSAGILVDLAGAAAGGIPGAIIAHEVARHARGTGAAQCVLKGTYYKV